jgi:phosphoserine aminotransferase
MVRNTKNFLNLRIPKLVIDMSSDFLSYPIDWTHIGLIYAGSTKKCWSIWYDRSDY